MPKQNSWKNALFGTNQSISQVPNFSPQQIAQQNQLAQMGMQGLQNLNFDFKPLEDKARRDFANVTVPTIANRFLTGTNSRNSSNFQNALSGGGQDLEASLAALRGQYNQQHMGNLLNMLRMGQQQQFTNVNNPAKPGIVGQAGGALLQYLPTLLGAYFGLPIPPLGGGSSQQNSQPTALNAPAVQPDFTGPSGSSPYAVNEMLQNLFQGINKRQLDEQYEDGGLAKLQELISTLGTPDYNRIANLGQPNIQNVTRFGRGL